MMTAIKALAEPTRFHIVEALREKPRSVNEIVIKLKLNQPQVSKHLKVLSDAGLVEMKPMAQQHVYALNPKHFKEIDDWLKPYRKLWEERFDRLDEYLKELQKK